MLLSTARVREVYEWVETSKRTSVLDKAESGHLPALRTQNHTENANAPISED